MLRKNFKEYPWYTLLLAIYPPIALLAHNIGEVEYSVAYRAIWMSGVASIILVLLAHSVFRDLQIAGLWASLILFGFFVYGPVFTYLRGWEINGTVIGRHTFFMMIWLGILLLLGWRLQKARKNFSILHASLSTISICLIVLPSFQLALYQFKIWQNGRKISAPKISLPTNRVGTSPDIYYIILDMYGRNDVLLEDFEHDDSAFLQELRELGFYVAECGQSNYASTAFSLSSALNISYLSEISAEFSPENTNTTLMWYLIQNNGVVQALKGQGYQTVAFETGYRWTELQHADHYYALNSNGINDFEDLLLRNSFVSVFFERGMLERFRLTSDQRKHDLSVFVLNELEKTPALAGPKFVFAHLTIPHPPFVVGPTGELEIIPIRYEGRESYYVEEEYKVGYINQVQYLNFRIPQVLSAILEDSQEPPIIIIQGDHGPRFVEIEKQFRILNAYYFPEPIPALHAWLSPVNNFRLIFSNYLGAELNLLPDQSYWSLPETPYNFEEFSIYCGANSK